MQPLPARSASEGRTAPVVRAPGWERLVESPWLIAALVALGLGLRAYHYLRDAPVWHDEHALIWNVLTKQGAELLGPLHYSEAAPPLFLALEQGVVHVLGDST